MNQIYKLVWSKSLNQIVVTSEVATSQGKASGSACVVKPRARMGLTIAGGEDSRFRSSVLSVTGAVTNGQNAMAIGVAASATGDNAYAIGTSSNAASAFSYVFGLGSNANGADALAMGRRSNAVGTSAVVIGDQSNHSQSGNGQSNATADSQQLSIPWTPHVP